MRIQLLVREYGVKQGLSRYTEAICSALLQASLEYDVVAPGYPLVVQVTHAALAPFGYDVKQFCRIYPVAAPLSRGSLTHMTSQQMASLFYFRPRLRPAVVTVHDIVPHLLRHDKEMSTFRHPVDRVFDSLSVRGLRHADHIIADSTYTRRTILEALSCPPDKITVIQLGVDHRVFRPMTTPPGFRERFGLAGDCKVVLYVGGEGPRKNLPRLLRAFARVKAALPGVKLIKAGAADLPAWHDRLLTLRSELALDDDVLFVNHLPEEDLVAFYNLADLFVFPSLYEGFGLPPLEAMACGAPVVCSDAASVPEVVGDAALTVDPHSVEELAAAMLRVLTEPDLREELRQKGLAQSQRFSWERTAQETIAIYRKFGA